LGDRESVPGEDELQEGEHVVLLETPHRGEDDLLLADVEDALEQVPVLRVNGLCAYMVQKKALARPNGSWTNGREFAPG
jgi:hypothetical protein